MMVKPVLLLEQMEGMGISMTSRGCREVMGIRLCDELESKHGFEVWKVKG